MSIVLLPRLLTHNPVFRILGLMPRLLLLLLMTDPIQHRLTLTRHDMFVRRGGSHCFAVRSTFLAAWQAPVDAYSILSPRPINAQQ